MTRAETRHYSLGLARLNTGTNFGLARIDATTDLGVGKINGLVQVVSHGMQGAALIGQLQHQLSEMVPSAAQATAYVASQGIIGLGSIVTDTAYKLRGI